MGARELESRVEHKSDKILLGLICLILLLAAGLRLYQLSQDSLWGDEIFEADLAQQNLMKVLGDKSSALRLLLTHFSMLVSQDEFFVRLPYALAGVLGVVMLYLVGKTLFDSETGLVGAFLLAVSSFHIRYSQEARGYAFTVVLVLTTLYCLYRALDSNKLGYWVGFAIFTALSLNNYIAAASVLTSEVVWAIIILSRERLTRPENQSEVNPTVGDQQLFQARWLIKRIRASKVAMLTFSLALAGGLFLPLGLYWLSYFGRIGVSLGGSSDGNVALKLSKSFLIDLFSQYSAGNGPALYLFLGAFVLGGIAGILQRQWRQILIISLWMVLPFFIVPRISSKAYFGPRHLIFLLPLYVVLVARGMIIFSNVLARLLESRIKNQARFWYWSLSLVALMGLFGGLSVAPIQAYYEQHKTDWRGASALLREQVQPGGIIFQPYVTFDYAMPYYLSDYTTNAAIDFVHLFTVRQIDGIDLPTDLWGVLFVSPSRSNEAGKKELETLLGSTFDVHHLPFIAVFHHKEPVVRQSDYWLITSKLIFVQALFDYALPNRLNWYTTHGLRAYSPLKQSQEITIKCAYGLYGPSRYIEQASEKLEQGLIQLALADIRKALRVHDVLYRMIKKEDVDGFQVLFEASNAAFTAGDDECIVAFYSFLIQAGQYEKVVDQMLRKLQTDALTDFQKAALILRIVDQLNSQELTSQAIRILDQTAPSVDNVDVWVALGKARMLQGRPDKAIPALEQAQGLAPQHYWANHFLAGLYARRGEWQAAIESAQVAFRVAEDGERRLNSGVRLAEAYENSGDPNNACTVLRQLKQGAQTGDPSVEQMYQRLTCSP